LKICVTGGAGFIGSALVKSFLEKNYTVVIFDNFSNSSEENVSTLLNKGVHKRMLEDLKKYTKFFAIEKNVPRAKWASTMYSKIIKK